MQRATRRRAKYIMSSVKLVTALMGKVINLPVRREWYLLSQLQKYRNGLRGSNPEDSFGQQMAGMTNTLPDEQAIHDVVAYIGTLEAGPPAPRTETSGDPSKGKETYNGTCTQCHGSKGQGLAATGDVYHPPAPRLTGQHDWYMIRQLQNYKSGIRGSHQEDRDGMVMQVRAKTLYKDQDITDVVAYIMTLQ